MKGLNFAQLAKRFQSRSVVTLSLESEELSGALLSRENAEVQATQHFTIPIGADGILSDPGRAGAALLETLERLKIRERRCVICIPRRWALSSTGEMPALTGSDLQDFLELRAEREFPVGVSELQLAHSAFTLADGQRLATVAGVPHRRLEAVQKMLEEASCRAVSLSLGLDHSARLGAERPSLQFVSNCHHVDLVVSAAGGVTAMRTLPGPREERFDAPSFVREVRITLGKLPAEVRRSLQEARFTGDEASIATLMGATEEPLRRLGIARLSVDAAEGARHPALEAGKAFLREQPVLFELLRKETSKWENAMGRFSTAQKRWLLLAVFAFVILPLVIYFVRTHTENSLTAEWDGMRKQVADLEALQKRMVLFSPWYKPAPLILSGLDALASSFPESGEVWAKSISVTDGNKVKVILAAKTTNDGYAVRDRLKVKPGVVGLKFDLSSSGGIKGAAAGQAQFEASFQWEPAL